MSKTIEKQYQKLSQLEHVLKRPDTYIGSIELETQTLWIYNEETEHFIEKEIENVPGLYKIFDEILVNAADNYQREGGKQMDEIRVIIDKEENLISVRNNGKGIPVQMHQDHGIFVPELIFGHLLTGSNYDDDQKKVVGGRNGYGAKLANIFSKSFIVECGDYSLNKKEFFMEWKDNMSRKGEAKITPYKKNEDYTCITFKPDLKRFKLTELTDDIVNLLKKRVYDMAGIFNSKVKVYLNNKKIGIKNFKDYIDMYIPDVDDAFKIYDKKMTTDRWEVLVSFSDGQPKQVSFVNAICTTRGGTHVQYIVDRIVDEIKKAIQKKNKKLEVKPHLIKSHLWIFVNSLIENPTFDSQTKETLTLKAQQFGSKVEITDTFIQKILKSGVIDSIINQAKAKENDKLLKTMKGGKKSKRLIGIPKLEDANDAGTKKSEECTIILTEGDSAKALAMAGIETIGRDNYGVFPLRGKLLNVRDADPKQILKNEEIQNMIKIIGLKAKEEYTSLKELRYGSVMIMADQDVDGSHIKGLVINMFQKFWPSLFSYKGFLREFVTPIVKCTNKTNEKDRFTFFSLTDLKHWKETVRNPDRYTIKYYKGLGTSNNKEAAEYFENLDEHQIDFEYVDEEDDKAIDMVFNKKKAEQRKQWLAQYDPDLAVDYSSKREGIRQLRYTDFVNQELIHFSTADNMRSIPSIMDGFKPGQRKILYSCFLKKLNSSIKVAQLSGYVSEKSAYHHGEISLQGTIIGMAQNFVGSNNINLLIPDGQFGSRNMGGKEHASARYLHTNLSKITRKLFPEPDDHCLKYLEDDGQSVEPEYYAPIIPLALVNGAEGIGTGWSTNVPQYNPKDLVQSIKNKLLDKDFEDLTPWYKGFIGQIQFVSSSQGIKKYKMMGIMEVKEDEEDILEIRELPIGTWTRNFKNDLEKLLEDENSGLIDIKESHACGRIHFSLEFEKKKLKNLQSKIKIEKSLSTTNMVFFNNNHQLTRYNNTIEIQNVYYEKRLEIYGKRKDYLISKLQREIEINTNKMKYINLVINDQIRYKKVKRKDLVRQLVQKGLVPMSKITKVKSTLKSQKQEKKEKADSDDDASEQEEEEVEGDNVPSHEYNYLCSMPMWSLTEEKIQKLQEQIDNNNRELNILEGTTLQQMWIRDLDDFLETLEEVDEQDEKDRLNQKSSKGGVKGKKNKGVRKAKGPVKRKKQAGDETSDSDNDFLKKIKKKDKSSNNSSEAKPKRGKKKKTDSDTESVASSSKKSKQVTTKKPPKQKSELDMTLEERLMKKNKDLGSVLKADDGKPKKKKDNKMKIDDLDLSDEDFGLKKKRTGKTIHNSKNSSDDDSETEFDKIKKKNKIVPKNNNNKKNKMQLDDSDSDDGGKRERPKRSRKALKIIESESDSEDDFGLDDDESSLQLSLNDEDDDDEDFQF